MQFCVRFVAKSRSCDITKSCRLISHSLVCLSHIHKFLNDLTFVQFADLRQFQELAAFKMGVTPAKDCKDPFKRTEGGVAVLVLLGLSPIAFCVLIFAISVFLILAEPEYLYTQSPCVAEPHACVCVPASVRVSVPVRVAEPLPVFVSLSLSLSL